MSCTKVRKRSPKKYIKYLKFSWTTLYRSDLVIYQVGNEQQQEQQQQQRDASGPAAHLDSLTTATGFTSFGDDLTSLNTSEMPSMPRQKNHQERAGSPVKTSLSLICRDWPNT